MEVGAVKQAFNNELILLKRNLNQAKIQIIHKLTRKAKQLTEKKAPEALQEKLKRKAAAAVKEVLIMKKIKARDIGKFAITHTGKLEDYLNKPLVDQDKACARLLLHKALQEKYKFIRNRFSNIPIKDLFMSRQERLKLKKEEKQKKKDKKKGKGKVVNVVGDWDVEDVKVNDSNIADEDLGDEVYPLDDDDNELPDSDQSVAGSDGSDGESLEEIIKAQKNDESGNDEDNDQDLKTDDQEIEDDADNNDQSDDQDEKQADIGKFIKPPSKLNNKIKVPTIQETSKKPQVNNAPLERIKKPKQDINQKDYNKNKNLNEKILKKKFKKDLDDTPIFERKIVDPFFITATGENYMSVAEPRPPDEVKEEHKQGNRKLRRAVMFGHVPKSRPRQNFRPENQSFDKQNRFNNRSNDTFDKQNGFRASNNKFSKFDNNFDNKRKRYDDRTQEDSKPEKLHPSWEAKKKQSGILPFKGKKIVFDDS